MGLLFGEMCKQTEANGGCVPKPGTTPITKVSVLRECLFGTTKLH